MYSEEIRKTVTYRRSLGDSIRKIAIDLNMKKGAVESIICYKKKAHKRKSGPKPKVTKCDQLKIKRYIATASDSGLKITCNKILQSSNIAVSRRTINNWMIKNDFKYQKKVQSIILSNKHKLERIRVVSNWIEENFKWDNAVFMDEKRFSLDGPDNWFTYAKKGKVLNRQRRQSNGGALMTWGMIMPNGLIALKILEGRQNTDKYISLFKEFAVPIMNINLPEGFVVVHDNCSIHVSRSFKEYLKTQSFTVREWPARSPDLNIMENIWKMISDKVYEGDQPLNLVQLKLKIHEAVLSINTDMRSTTMGLFNNFLKRLPKVLLRKGDIIN